jgi:hypothetical protein
VLDEVYLGRWDSRSVSSPHCDFSFSFSFLFFPCSVCVLFMECLLLETDKRCRMYDFARFLWLLVNALFVQQPNVLACPQYIFLLSFVTFVSLLV